MTEVCYAPWEAESVEDPHVTEFQSYLLQVNSACINAGLRPTVGELIDGVRLVLEMKLNEQRLSPAGD